MSPENGKANLPDQNLVLVCGDDDFEVKIKSQDIVVQWKKGCAGLELETIDGQSGNAREALAGISSVKAALETLSLFGTGKIVWFRYCNFLGEGRVATAKQTGDGIEGLLATLKACDWRNTRFLVSASSVDKRKRFYKWVKQSGQVISCESLSAQGEAAESIALDLISAEVRRASKTIQQDVAERLIRLVGLNRRAIVAECEKAILHAGENDEVTYADIESTVSPTRQAKAFAFADAVADRQLESALARLEDEVWSMRTDRQKTELGLLYGLISKFRNMLQVKDLVTRKRLCPERNYARFRLQFNALDRSQFSEDRRFNPLSQNPYVIFRAVSQVGWYTETELIRALEMLMVSNQRMISVSVNPASVLRECVMEIVLGRRCD
ncbi:MAG: hypothetical protein M2R45_02596 [Verrucomicrobia subdivision 3 bacterium]|nr:hypothetical protein [Limisphaerales bacterium]MCS1416434.1 hypothetical protein [Limisphaerales bacterium]